MLPRIPGDRKKPAQRAGPGRSRRPRTPERRRRLMPPVHHRGPAEKPKDMTGTLRRLLGTLGRFKAAFFAVLVFAMLSTLFNIAGPRILAEATTALATGWMAMITG